MTRIETTLRSIGSRKVTRTATPAITNQAIKAMKVPQVRADGAVAPGAGRLKVRKRSGARGSVVEWLFMWQSTSADAQTDTEPTKRLSTITLGKFTEQPRPGYLTIEQARRRAAELQELVRAGVDPALARREERHETKRQQEAKSSQLREREASTFQALFDTYVAHLVAQGKQESAYDARNMFSNHVTAAFPRTAAMPAAEISAEHISEILGRLVRPADGGQAKGRTALKLRSYVGAAFRLALGATTDPMAPSAAAGYGVTVNPAAAVPSTRMAHAFNRAGTRVLSTQELRIYLRRLEEIPSMVNRLALQLQLMTGGQRVQQLLRLTARDVGETTFTLYDGKGRRSQARPHALPLIPEVADVLAQLCMLAALAENNPTDSLFIGRRGAVVNPETLSGEVAAISAAMMEADEARHRFRLGDVRRTCETMMAETLGISKDTRAQLLSHGISGVQAVHYDKGEHLEAKTAALQAWVSYLQEVRGGATFAQQNKVVPIRMKTA